MNAPNTKKDFSHLKKIGGVIPSLPSLLARSVDRWHKTGVCQFLLFIGPLGVGKSTHVSLALDFLSSKVGESRRVTLVTFETAQKIAAEIREKVGIREDLVLVPILERLDPKHQSGYYTDEDYQGGSLVFGLLLYLAGQESDLVLVEVPGVGTKDRGMSALADLIRKRGKFERLSYEVWVTAFTANASLYRKNMMARLSNVAFKTAGYPGGTGLGTLVAIEEAAQSTAHFFRNRKKPILAEMRDPNTFRRHLPIMLRSLAVDFYPWLLLKEYKMSPDRTLIVENTEDKSVSARILPEITDYWRIKLQEHIGIEW